MIRMVLDNVERLIPDDKVNSWEKRGYVVIGRTDDDVASQAVEVDVAEKAEVESESADEPSVATEETTYTEDELKKMTVAKLKTIAYDRGIQGAVNMNKDTLIQVILALGE